MNVIEFIYQLNKLGFSIWLEGTKLKYRQYKEYANKNEVINQIKSNKTDIIKVLSINNCYSCNLANQQYIYRSTECKGPLSFAQERLWFIEKYEEGTSAYNIPVVYKISNECKLDILERSIKAVVNRHEILRTVIKENKEGVGYQLILNDQEFPLKINMVKIADKDELDNKLKKELNYVFNLAKEYPIKICLYSLDNDNLVKDIDYLSIVIHHIAFDGWSMDIFLKELRIYYDYYLKQSQGLRPKLDLPELSIQYKDFALWQRSYLSDQKLNEQLNYWKKNLNGYETLNLITDNLRPNQVDYTGQNIDFELDKSTSISLRELAKELKVSLYSILLSGYYLLLRCYSNQDDIVVGTPVANRHYSQIENLIGFFVNSLALRTNIDSNISIKEFIQKVGNEVIEAQLYQDLPFEKLVEELKILRDTSRHPIFQVWFITQSFGNEIYKQNQESTISLTNLLQSYITDSFYKASQFDIALFINDGELTLKGTFNYALSLYNEKTINGFIETYIHLLKQIINNYNQKINELNYLTTSQYQQIIYDWNHTDKEYSSDKSIHQLFEEQVDKAPDYIAVIYKETKLTYKELNEKVNQLANYLKQIHDIKSDTLVALCLDRSEHMLIAILAVLKAGGAYVPIDPNYPDDRIHYILTNTNTKLALTNEVYGKKLSQVNALNIITLDNEILQQQLSLQSAANLKTAMSNTDLIYVIYTSGTTGNPKGVMIEHRSIVNRIQWMNNVYNLNRSDKILQKTPYVFDVSVWELLWANCYGGCVVFAEPNGHKDIQYIIDLIAKESITIVHFVPSMLNALLETVESEGISSDIISKLRYVFCSGEALSLKQVQKFQKLLPKVAIHNLYGPTEASVDVLSYDCNNQNIQAVLIGKAIQNTTLYVLDDSLNPVPIGAVGELYIGGIGLARGYLNKPELTAEKFIANPFQTEEEKIQNNNARLYKTGDLVRWLSDGNLEYIGRNDFQVKIRGYRIELGEVENVISSYDGIKQSVVVVKESVTNIDSLTDNKYLVGYYVRNIELNNEDRENFIATWEEVYQSQYVSLNINNFKQNTISWNSSYTGEAIPQKEMVEWVNSTIERIKSLNPKVILEIGSGTGLILFNIIDSCNYYYATDLSQNAVDYINTVINKFGYSNKITALICSASDIAYNKLEKSYDTVIMNSIVQYFPNLDYLESVITEAILNIKDQGQIFIGDIRDYRLLKCFHYSVQSYKNQQVTKAEIDYFVKREKELLVSPEYFIYLRTVIDAISHVEIMPKIGQANNEMNKYRYDVILYVNKNQEAVKNGICVSASEFINVLNFEEHLDQENDYLCIKYPNKRIIEDYIGYNALDKEKIITLDNDNILSISEIIEKVKNSNYKAKFLVDVNDPLYLNIILYTSEKNIYLDYSPSGKLLKSNLANNPLMSYKLLENEFSAALKDYLNTRLPEYMVPGSLVHLESLPLTINGKLDKKALPDPEFTSSDNYVAPRTELEKQVCEIWANLLGLAIGKVGINDDFFRLGGNSMLAIRLVSRLNKELNSNISTSTIFKHTTVNKLLQHLKFNNDDNIVITKSIISKLEEQFLSFAQERLWFIEKYEEGTNAYNIAMIYYVSNECKLDILERSIKAIVNRHEILRTVIKEDKEGVGYQLVLSDKELPLEIDKIKVASNQELDSELKKELNHIFNLSKECPIRICLYELINKSSINYYLSIVIHHIAFDGWSVDIFLKELQIYYDYYLKQSQGLRSELDLPKLSIQYKDFALWQRIYLSGQRLSEQLNYWKNKLSGYEKLNLITDNPRPNRIDYKGQNINFELDRSASIFLRELAKELKVSLYSVLLSGYYLLLRCYSNQDDIVIGTPVANRHYNQIENLIGFFVNSLALRTKVDSNISIKEFIQKIGNGVIEAQFHQDLPFEKLVEELKIPKDTSRHPIFQVMFGVQGFGNLYNKMKAKNTSIIYEYSTASDLYNVAKFDISTFIDDSEVILKGSFNYAVNLYTEVTINRFVETYIEILKQLAEIAYDKQKQDKIKIAELSYLNSRQYQQIIYDWNQTDKGYPNNKTINQLFEEQVDKTPDNVAIVYEETKLTYKELNEKANQLANYLKQVHDIKPDTLIALCLDRREYMLIAILAVLKAGGAYVPIDPSYPDSRIHYILTDTNTKLIITSEIHKLRLEEISKQQEVVTIDSRELQEQLLSQSINNLKTVIENTDLAYVIYTSGTTGNPKGVMIEHRGVINIKESLTEKYQLNKFPEVILQFSNYVFDASVEQIVLALLNGHTLLLISDKMWEDIKYFHAYLQKNNVTHIHATPSFLIQLDFKRFARLKRVISGGEELSVHCFKKLKTDFSNVINEYGPTETTVTSVINIDGKNISIGKPIANTKAYVLGKDLTPLPIGAIGELYIGGIGVARGYLNNHKLTQKQFVPNPFQTLLEKQLNYNGYLYKSGDLVRWLPDGNIEYIGRNDFQVKIRGYRIELEEVENVMSSYDGVKQSVAVVKKSVGSVDNLIDNQYLVGYYVAAKKLDEDNILSYLQEKLPEYMVPHTLMHLTELPLTINGKLDRRALPESNFSSSNSYMEPRNELERKICHILAEVLGLNRDEIGIYDEFFKLGGNSILAVRLTSRINDYYKSYLKVADIFIYKNIALLSSRITQTKESYQTIIKLNNICEKPNLFMIHPGEGGCEVYTSLADILASNFSCYGIDSYNLYHKNKIDKLYELATYYLSYIDEIMTKTNQKTYNFLGWSLGGYVALEMACILERRGYVNIKIYLLDTTINDKYILYLTNKIEKICNTKESQTKLRDYLISQGYDKLYVEKVISAMGVENQLAEQTLSSTLQHSHIILFKAMCISKPNFVNEAYYELNKLYQYLFALKYNNVDKVIKNKSNIKLIKVDEVYHGNILTKEKFLAFNIR